ncbi:hypothetical protein GCM10027416_01660 [Okibacterium endophyticum]
MVQEGRFRRLLRWYPRAWRERNGDVLLGAMLDEAERNGRTAPTPSERFSAALHGLATRLTAQVALRSALIAMLAAALAGIITVWAVAPMATAGLGWVLPVLTTAICPGLAVLGAASLIRHRGLLSEPRVIAVLSLSLLAVGGSAVTALSWSAGFNAADEGLPTTGIATVWPWLFLASWALGATAIAVLVDGLLRQSRLRRIVCVILAALAGIVLAPLIGIQPISPYIAALVATGVTLLALATIRREQPAPPVVPPVAASIAVVPRRTQSLARGLALISAVTSTVGVVYALTGTSWFPGGPDGTAVMGQGITIALVSALPLLAGTGVLVTARTSRHPAHAWGPLLLVLLSFAAEAVAYLNAPEWEDMAPATAVGAILGGTAIAWWIIPRLSAPARIRAAAGVLIGIGYAAFLGMLIAPMLSFAIPVLAVAFVVWAPRNPRPGLQARFSAASAVRPSLKHALAPHNVLK